MGIRSLRTASISTGVKRSKVWDQSAVYSPTAYESIQTVTVGAGGASSITFSSIPSTYKHLQIRISQRSSSATTNYTNSLQFNGDSTSANYRQHYLYGNNTTISAGTYQNWYISFPNIPAAGNTAGVFGASIIDILDYANTSKYKTVRAFSGYEAISTDSGVTLDSMLWMNTNAISSINMTAYTGTLAQYSQFALYGIKG